MKAKLDIVIRLGGFHTLMSFLGSIGHIMKGSGFEEVLGLLFGSNPLEHVLSGKAYDWAIRGHFVVHAALTELLLDYLQNCPPDAESPSPVATSSDVNLDLAGAVTPADMAELEALYEQVMHDKVRANETDSILLQNKSFASLTVQLDNLKHTLSEQSRTARLWLLYMQYIELLKLYLLAERTSN